MPASMRMTTVSTFAGRSRLCLRREQSLQLTAFTTTSPPQSMHWNLAMLVTSGVARGTIYGFLKTKTGSVATSSFMFAPKRRDISNWSVVVYSKPTSTAASTVHLPSG